MNRIFIRTAAIGALFIAASPAAAVSPATPGSANLKVYKALTISSVQNLDFGVIVLTGASFTNETVTISQAGTLTCGSNPGVILTCTGNAQAAQYKLVGTNNTMVTITCPAFNLTGAGTLAFAPSAPPNVSLGAAGATTGVTFSVGGSITLASTTPDGTYSGNFQVTANYQ